LSLTTALDVARTLEYLAYLGFNNAERNQAAAVIVTRDKRLDWKARETRRTVFHCHVIGPKDVGKVGQRSIFRLTQPSLLKLT